MTGSNEFRFPHPAECAGFVACLGGGRKIVVRGRPTMEFTASSEEKPLAQLLAESFNAAAERMRRGGKPEEKNE